jgi:hypothetical protein
MTTFRYSRLKGTLRHPELAYMDVGLSLIHKSMIVDESMI